MSDRPPVMAIDCDLHKLYCWCSECGKVCQADDGPGAIIVHGNTTHKGGHLPTVIMEVASPVSAQRGNIQQANRMYQLTRWVIYNSAMMAFFMRPFLGRFFVAPSNVWTKGHPAETRHLLAGCRAPEKNLRECEAMIWFFQHEPTRFVDAVAYLESI